MSTEQDQDQEPSFQEQLENVYAQHRHYHLEEELDELASIMKETILQRMLADSFFEDTIEIDDDAKAAVENARELLEQGAYEALEAELPTLQEQVKEQERMVTNHIHERRYRMQETVEGMIRLNERVKSVDHDELAEIESLLDQWDWDEYVPYEETDLITAMQYAAEFGREHRIKFDEARENIFGPYQGTPLEPVVDRLLSDDRPTYASLTEAQLRQLEDSDLADYIELTLS